MKRFRCRCGSSVFFENFTCLVCGAVLGFDPEALEMRTLVSDGAGGLRAPHTNHGGDWTPCKNREDFGVCNWLVEPGGPPYCMACRLNEVIPNLSSDRNLELWRRIEQAKRRLIYGLRRLGLHLARPGGGALSFRFLEDQRSNPDVSESFVLTGHMGGTITINLAEADDSVRHAVREDMQERYRTLLGHFRHESGHYYFTDLVSADAGAMAEFRSLFGDERADYAAALQAYYRNPVGPSIWQDRYVSGYASAHPWEDWAETWAHYLHMTGTLETAVAWQLVDAPDMSEASREWVDNWGTLSVIANDLNRSMGTDDFYPFVLTPTVIEKLMFVHRRVARTAGSPAISAAR